MKSLLLAALALISTSALSQATGFDDSVDDVGPFMAPDACNNIVGYQAAPPAGYGIVDGACLAPCVSPSPVISVTQTACPNGQAGQVVTTTTTSYHCTSTYGPSNSTSSQETSSSCSSSIIKLDSPEAIYHYAVASNGTLLNPQASVISGVNREGRITISAIRACNEVNTIRNIFAFRISSSDYRRLPLSEKHLVSNALAVGVGTPGVVSSAKRSVSVDPLPVSCGEFKNLPYSVDLDSGDILMIQGLETSGHSSTWPKLGFDLQQDSVYDLRTTDNRVIRIRRHAFQPVRQTFYIRPDSSYNLNNHWRIKLDSDDPSLTYFDMIGGLYPRYWP